jgi:hypothetical protein
MENSSFIDINLYQSAEGNDTFALHPGRWRLAIFDRSHETTTKILGVTGGPENALR